MTSTLRPTIGVLAVTCRGDRVLLAKRSIPPGIGKWGFPGGKQELGETVFDCARRELLEETGIDADPVMTLDVLDMIRRDETGAVATHFTLVCVLCDWRAGEGAPLQDATEVAWFTPEEARALDTFPDAVDVMIEALDYLDDEED